METQNQSIIEGKRSKKMNGYLKQLIVEDLQGVANSLKSLSEIKTSPENEAYWTKWANGKRTRLELGLKTAASLGIELPQTLTNTQERKQQ